MTRDPGGKPGRAAFSQGLRGSGVSLLVVGCMSVLTGAAFIAAAYTDFGWLTALLGIVVIALVVGWICLLLAAVESRRDGP